MTASNHVSGLSKRDSDFFGFSFSMSASLGDETKSLAGGRKGQAHESERAGRGSSSSPPYAVDV